MLRWMFVVCLGLSLLAPAAEPARKDYPVQPVPFTAVRVDDGFWSPRMKVNREVTVPYAFQQCEETGRIDNFAIAGKLKKGQFRGIFFNDSDVFKVMEGAAYALHLYPDPKLDAYLDGVIAKVAAAQEPDGYLYTARTLFGPEHPESKPPGGKERWTDIYASHELYNVGHMYEAAAAHYLATGKRNFLDVALKNANLVCNAFGTKPGQNPNPCGHQEIELGLVKLYRVTGDKKYLDQAKFFVDARGSTAHGRTLYGVFCQDTKPILEQTEPIGHAVRAGYMYAALADIAALTGDARYLKAASALWDNVAGRKLYLTGGIGGRGEGEAFGEDYELPNLMAYAETCANIANALWNHRMFCLTGDGRYMDVVESVIFNSFLSGISMDGKGFFYPNPLEAHSSHGRAPWFGCACCPSNVVRFMPSIPGYAYAHEGDNLYVNLFMGGSAKVDLPAGAVQVRQETRYPWDGGVKITVEPAAAAKFAVLVRIPSWAQGQPLPNGLYRDISKPAGQPTLKVNGQPVLLQIEKGYARIERTWSKGDVIELALPMSVRRVIADERIVSDRGRVALQRGPIVYCAESADQPDGRVLSLVLPDGAPLSAEYRRDLLNGIVAITAPAKIVGRAADAAGTPIIQGEQTLTAIPYYAWAHRQRGEMAVWLAREPAATRPRPRPSIALASKVTASAGEPASALSDQFEPRNSADIDIPAFRFWHRRGTREWVEYAFPAPRKVSAVEVYWANDTGTGVCRLPASWRLLARTNGQWTEVPNPSGYGTEKDRYNRTTFAPLTADALRIEVQLPEGFSAGIHEWRVE